MKLAFRPASGIGGLRRLFSWLVVAGPGVAVAPGAAAGCPGGCCFGPTGPGRYHGGTYIHTLVVGGSRQGK